MIKNLTIHPVHMKIYEKTAEYSRNKIGSLDKYIPQKAREGTSVDIRFMEKNVRDRKTHVCEVIMKLPRETITVKKDSTTVVAAVDAAVDTLKTQLEKYKGKYTHQKIDRKAQFKFKESLI